MRRPTRRIGSNAPPIGSRFAMPRSALQPISLLLLLHLLAFSGCGGGSTRTADSPNRESSGEGYEGSEEGDSLPECEDGTCFACGEVYCPNGFYCDDNAPGGAGCSWLPECAEAASCSCVESALGDGCACDEHDGGVHVQCE